MLVKKIFRTKSLVKYQLLEVAENGAVELQIRQSKKERACGQEIVAKTIYVKFVKYTKAYLDRVVGNMIHIRNVHIDR